MIEEEESVSSYFARHKIEPFITELLKEIGREAPEDPLRFMLDYISRESPDSSRGQLRYSAGIDSVAEIVRAHLQRLEVELSDLDNCDSTEDGINGVPPEASKSVALRKMYMMLRDEQQSAVSFLNEWINNPEKLNVPKTTSIMCRKLSTGAMKPAIDESLTPTYDDEGSLLESMLSWDFDSLETDDATLLHNCMTIFDLWGFTREGDDAHVDAVKLQNYITCIYNQYNSDIPYHTFKHAYSVFTGTANLLRAGATELFNICRVEELGLLIAALVHDVGHPGQNNDFFIKSRHKLAITYNDQSVLENMHCAVAFETLAVDANNFLSGWSSEKYSIFRKTVLTSILNTDMKVHFDLTSRLQEIPNSDAIDPSNLEQRKLLISVIVHAADLSNAVLTTELCRKWSLRVITEFHDQYEKEVAEGLPAALFMKCDPGNQIEVAKLQASFIEYVAGPMWQQLALIVPKLSLRWHQLSLNLSYWQHLLGNN